MLQRLRKLLPFGLRLELLRLHRYPEWLLETPTIARRRAGAPATEQPGRFSHLAVERCSPLRRFDGEEADDAEADAEADADAFQLGKEHNVALAARLIDGLVVEPNKIFSYHRLVGRPSRLRGFRVGLELRQGAAASGVGGGCCQVSNMLYLLALLGGMRVTERHRHGLDLFPDRQRSVPFGCGATVFYNYADLRFENPLPQPALLRLEVMRGGRELRGQLWLLEDPGWRVEIYEQDHRFYRREGRWMRENRIRRRIVSRRDHRVLLDQEVAHNVARVLYEPEPAGARRQPVGLPEAA
jgi:vancomycin resistance protein VanW